MAGNTTNGLGADGTKLGCGRSMDQVWDRVGQTPDAHEAHCPDCQAARANLAELAEATRSLAAADEADPTLHASPSVIAHILQVARAEVRRGKLIPLFTRPAGSTSTELAISEQTIGGVVRRTCDQMLGVEARRCHVELYAPSEPSPTESPGTPIAMTESEPWPPAEVAVRLSVSVAPRVAIPPLINAIRARVVDALATEVGISARTIDVSVEDLTDAF